MCSMAVQISAQIQRNNTGRNVSIDIGFSMLSTVTMCTAWKSWARTRWVRLIPNCQDPRPAIGICKCLMQNVNTTIDDRDERVISLLAKLVNLVSPHKMNWRHAVER